MIKVNRFYNFDLKGMEQYFNEQALKGYEIDKINETYFIFKKISPKKSYYHFIMTGECEGRKILKTPQFSLYETNEPLETETFTKWGYEGMNISFIFISGLFVLLQLFGLKYPYYDDKIRPIMLVITGVLLLISFIDGYWLIKNKKQYRLNQVSKPSYRYGLSLFVFIYLFINAIFLNVPLILPLFYLLFYGTPWSKVRGAIIIAFSAILILPMWIDIPPYLGTPIKPYINFEVDHKVFDSTYGYFLSTENYYAYSNTNEESFVFEYYKAKDSHVLEETIKKHQNIFTPIESEFDACFKGEQNNKVFYNIVHNKQFLLITTTPNNAEGALDFAYEKLGVN